MKDDGKSDLVFLFTTFHHGKSVEKSLENVENSLVFQFGYRKNEKSVMKF